MIAPTLLLLLPTAVGQWVAVLLLPLLLQLDQRLVRWLLVVVGMHQGVVRLPLVLRLQQQQQLQLNRPGRQARMCSFPMETGALMSATTTFAAPAVLKGKKLHWEKGLNPHIHLYGSIRLIA
jgi:hypothetical protein